LARRGDEGRGWLRKAPERCQATFDPEVSEWGNPRRFDRPSRTEYIGAAKPTLGSETSQYREEKKSNETPEVVASETGPGQTQEIRLLGVVGPP